HSPPVGSGPAQPMHNNDRDPAAPIWLQRWAARATDSQFNAIAGAIGGFTSGVVTCPLDVIKTKLQAQGGVARAERAGSTAKMYSGLVGTSRVIWQEEGIRGMYRGLGPIVLGYLPTWAVWFTVYNEAKVVVSRYCDNVHVINLWCSIIAGGCSTIATNPIWVIKTRLMSQRHMGDRPGSSPATKTASSTSSALHYRSTIDAARKMYSTEGLASFYSGLSPALLGLSHVAVQFPTYEYLKMTFTGQGMGEAPAPGQGSHWIGILSASVLSKMMASSATYPHEVIRTRLQTQRRQQLPSGGGGGPKYRGIAMTFRTILREEGWRAFYAGLGTNMTRAVPAATVTMLTYEFVMKHLNMARDAGRAMIQEEPRL
ncbi:solute carrier family 25 (mitochondrial folate transporter), member 32, partial [Geosmithia morbida]